MIACIPMADGQTIPSIVYRSLGRQTIACDIVPCVRPGVVKSNHWHKPDKRLKLEGQTNSRNACREYMLSSRDEVALMIDRDVVLLEDDVVQTAWEEMGKFPNIGAIALPWKDYFVNGHFKLQAVMLRVAALKNVPFRIDARLHGCKTFYEDMTAAGWECTILASTRKMILELVEA